MKNAYQSHQPPRDATRLQTEAYGEPVQRISHAATMRGILLQYKPLRLASFPTRQEPPDNSMEQTECIVPQASELFSSLVICKANQKNDHHLMHPSKVLV